METMLGYALGGAALLLVVLPLMAETMKEDENSEIEPGDTK
jgi:hypothetical protein